MKILLPDADAGVLQVLTWLMVRLVAQARDARFMQGHRWAAVVLLDEADVLMKKRTACDLQRNAIVAS